MRREMLKFFAAALSLVALCFICGSGFSTNPADAKADEAAQSEAATMTCPKCGGAMEAGVIRDYWNVNSYDKSAWWPDHQKFHLLSQGKSINITAYRCANCGYVESYAK